MPVLFLTFIHSTDSFQTFLMTRNARIRYSANPRNLQSGFKRKPRPTKIFDVISAACTLALLIIIIIICFLNTRGENNGVIAGRTYSGILKATLKLALGSSLSSFAPALHDNKSPAHLQRERTADIQTFSDCAQLPARSTFMERASAESHPLYFRFTRSSTAYRKLVGNHDTK